LDVPAGFRGERCSVGARK